MAASKEDQRSSGGPVAHIERHGWSHSTFVNAAHLRVGVERSKKIRIKTKTERFLWPLFSLNEGKCTKS